MNNGVNYSLFYDILLNLREYFHSYGRIDDSNAKLDEIIKLIALSYSLAKRGQRFSLGLVRKVAIEECGSEHEIAKALRLLFKKEASSDFFQNDDGTNIFGANPNLSIQNSENNFAEKIISEIEKIDFVCLIQENKYSEFDIINECFGHFVRDNFRNNKEDAQYMTPYELSQSVLDIIFNDMEKHQYLTSERLRNFIVMDPTCGVGTLLIESSNHYTRYIKHVVKDIEEQEELINKFRSKGIVGQDKVERMVRLSKINALLLGSNPSNINIGNSIVGKSSINNYQGKINLIFTNPPFGAEFSRKDINESDYPILVNSTNKAKTVSSELLLLDKCINYLDDEGYVAIVLPDAVFTSRGLYSDYRDYIINNYRIVGVIGLPSVTFAQAGTRTNTCILIVQKTKPQSKVFMADCKDLGFIVKERSGVPVKLEQGTNEMPLIATALATNNKSKILLEKPSVTQIDEGELIGNSLKPSFYAAERYKTIDALKNNIKNGYKIVRLKDVVKFVTKTRKSFMVSNEIKHISVLHINPNCTIDFGEVDTYSPICKGRECSEGDIIISKINPRIPRMAVVPKYPLSLVCSNEFEIMRPTGVIGGQLLCCLLKSKNVMRQIENLTAGTSSSHSRIKTEQLADILIPIPDSEDAKKECNRIEEALEDSINSIYHAEASIREQMTILNSL